MVMLIDANGIYIDKETGLPIRQYMGSVTNNDKEKFGIVTDYKYEFNVVTDENLKEPDIAGYKVQDNN